MKRLCRVTWSHQPVRATSATHNTVRAAVSVGGMHQDASSVLLGYHQSAE